MNNQLTNSNTKTDLRVQKATTLPERNEINQEETNKQSLEQKFAVLVVDTSMNNSESDDINNLHLKDTKRETSEDKIISNEKFELTEGVPSTCFSNQSNISDNEGDDSSSVDLKKDESISIDSYSYTLSPESKDFKSIEIKELKDLLPDIYSSKLQYQEEMAPSFNKKKISVNVTKASTSEPKTSVRPSSLKALLREFKKYFIKDFKSFEKESRSLKSMKKAACCQTLQSYLEARSVNSSCLNHDECERCSMHYTLGLLINPKFVLSCTHIDSLREKSLNDCKAIIQDLLLKCTINRVSEYFKCENNKALFLHFTENNADMLSKFEAECSLVKSLF